MVYILGGLLTLLCRMCLLCVYSSNLTCYEIKLQFDLKFWNICSSG